MAHPPLGVTKDKLAPLYSAVLWLDRGPDDGDVGVLTDAVAAGGGKCRCGRAAQPKPNTPPIAAASIALETLIPSPPVQADGEAHNQQDTTAGTEVPRLHRGGAKRRRGVGPLARPHPAGTRRPSHAGRCLLLYSGTVTSVSRRRDRSMNKNVDVTPPSYGRNVPSRSAATPKGDPSVLASTGGMTIVHTLAGMALFLGICASVTVLLALALAGLARLEP